MKKITVYTDGACSGNPGPGGWAALLLHEGDSREIAGGEAQTTNNRMELMAAIGALTTLKEPCEVTVYTDSKYVKDGMTSWIHNWKKNGWKTAAKKPTLNADLWRKLDEAASKHQVNWLWVKGHAGDPQNERVDELAVAELEKHRTA